MNSFTIFYLVWAAVGIAVEVVGIRRKKRGDTLSDQVWWFQKVFAPGRFLVAGFLVWLFIHFMFEG